MEFLTRIKKLHELHVKVRAHNTQSIENIAISMQMTMAMTREQLQLLKEMNKTLAYDDEMHTFYYGNDFPEEVTITIAVASKAKQKWSGEAPITEVFHFK